MATGLELGGDSRIQVLDGDEWKTLGCIGDVRFEPACPEGAPWSGFWGSFFRGDFLVSKVDDGWEFKRVSDGWSFKLLVADTAPDEAEVWDELARTGMAIDLELEVREVGSQDS